MNDDRAGDIAVDDLLFVLLDGSTDGVWRLARISAVAEGGITTNLAKLPVIGDLFGGDGR